MKNLETAHQFGRVFGHLDAIEHALQQIMNELASGPPAFAGVASRTREALVHYQETKTDWVRLTEHSQEEKQIADAIHRGLKAGRAQAVSRITEEEK